MTALIEAGLGLALLVSPALTVSILIGAPFDTPADSIVGRVAGAALFALGLACWLAQNDQHARAAKGLIVSLLLYNVAAAIVLVYAGLGLRLVGTGLWPAAVFHVVMAIWCITNLRS